MSKTKRSGWWGKFGKKKKKKKQKMAANGYTQSDLNWPGISS